MNKSVSNFSIVSAILRYRQRAGSIILSLLAMNPTPYPTDELFELELRIAKRADELVRETGMDREHSLDLWRQAEREFWQTRDAKLSEELQPQCA